MASISTKMLLRVMGVAILLLNLVSSSSSYVNHTVGGDAGWFFNTTTNKTSADYIAWAAKQTFSLGDFLIFNTNTNHTVIQTYNETTYKSCTADDALDSDTFYYYVGGDNEFGKATTLTVPLTIESTQYYFSDGDDGVQCLNGMGFEIKVSHGQGLPPSLNQPPPPAYVPPPGSAVEGESPPISVATSAPPTSGTNILASFTCIASLLAAMVLHLALL